MTQAVNIPGVGTVNFPDGMAQGDIESAIQKNFPQIHNNQPKGAVDPSAFNVPGQTLAGGAEGLADTAIKGLATIPAGLMGAAGFVKGLLTPGQNAGDVGQGMMERTQEMLTPPQLATSPRAQAANQAVQNKVSQIAGLPSALAGGASDAIVKGLSQPNNPAYEAQLAQYNARLQAATNFGANALPMLLGPKGSPISDIKPEATPFKQANDLGYSIMPSEAAIKGGSSPVGKVVEGLAGSAKTGVDATVKNQAVTNRLAAQEIGAPPGTPLTDGVLANLRKPLNAIYDKVSSLGSIPTDKSYFNELNDVGRTPGNSFPLASDPDIQALKQIYAVPKFDAGDAVLQIRNLRKNATANYKAASANQVKNAPMLGELADAQQGIADALENQLERFVGSPADKVGNPKLIEDWRNARQGLAKINTVDNAIREGTTDVSAPALAKQLNKGVPLSGNLRAIADTANAFPISVRDIGAVRNKVPINALEGLMGTGGIGAALLGSPHAAAGLAAGMIARPLGRAALLSQPMQRAMLPSAPINPLLSQTGRGALINSLIQGNKQ